jgi:hypothetical protein
MAHGPERARLISYLQGAKHESTDAAGDNWVFSGKLLEQTATAIRMGAKKVRDGDGDEDGLSGVTAQAVLDAFTASAESMQEKGVRVQAAGEALKDTAKVIKHAQQAEKNMTELQEPAAYTPPTYSPGYQPTPEEITTEGNKRQAANADREAYNTARAQQEAAATQWSEKLDAVFLGSIPPMQAIHGEPDPTEPPPTVPVDPTGPSLPPTTPGNPGDPGDPGDPGIKDPRDPEKPE